MPQYQNSKIYELVCSETGKRYIGSTTQKLYKRLWGHKHKNNSCMSKTFINPKIYLIENTPCNSKEELLSIERKYILNTECINKQIPLRTKKEWTEDNKEQVLGRQHNWYENNKERISKNAQKYYLDNKEEKLEYQKVYSETHKEHIKTYNNKYYQKNKDRELEKKSEQITCYCGVLISYGNKARHLKSQKHINELINLSL